MASVVLFPEALFSLIYTHHEITRPGVVSHSVVHDPSFKGAPAGQCTTSVVSFKNLIRFRCLDMYPDQGAGMEDCFFLAKDRVYGTTSVPPLSESALILLL